MSTTGDPVRRRGYFSGAATVRNGGQLVAETESTPKCVVRSAEEAVARRTHVLPGLTAAGSSKFEWHELQLRTPC